MNSYFENKDTKIYTSYHKRAHSFGSHFHNRPEIAHCFSGVQQIKLDKTIYTLKGGDTLIIFPNTIHEYIESEQSDIETEFIAIICATELSTGNLSTLFAKEPECPLIKAGSLSENATLALRKMVDAKSELELLGWSYIAIAGIMNVLKLKPLKPINPKLAPGIISYINENFKKPLTLSALAKELGYNQSYIAHFFCDKLKIPFRTYLGSVRSEYVAEMIKSTDKSLTEIAYDAGFESLNTFCRCFKKHFGKTPSQYKRDYRSC